MHDEEAPLSYAEVMLILPHRPLEWVLVLSFCSAFGRGLTETNNPSHDWFRTSLGADSSGSWLLSSAATRSLEILLAMLALRGTRQTEEAVD